MVADDSEIFRLDNLEPEVDGGVSASTPFGTRVLSRQ
jgi:hypothetical protein